MREQMLTTTDTVIALVVVAVLSIWAAWKLGGFHRLMVWLGFREER